jgi:hypothetical protein
MDDASVHWYKSKVDWWLVPLLALPPISSILVAITLAQQGVPTATAIGFGVVLFVAALYLGVIFPLRYGIDRKHLIIRTGLIRQRIELDKITEVIPTRNPLSSPALSLDRLRVQFGQGIFKAVMISPNERDEFLTELATAAGLQRHGDQLVNAKSASS